MLSYQHAYHAGNLADLHKHSLLAWMLEYLTRKDKPLSYIETHAGRGLYDLSGPEALKTGEAAQGIVKHADWFGADHPFSQARQDVILNHGVDAYPGSPAIAASVLRDTDTLTLAELHPGERRALSTFMGKAAKIYAQDGFAMAHAVCPPTPRRGLMLIDPPYEVKQDYDDIPKHIAKLHRAWNVGVIALWYPILANRAQTKMVQTLRASFPQALSHEVSFPPAREGHGMIGSGMFVLNPPFGLHTDASNLTKHFAAL